MKYQDRIAQLKVENDDLANFRVRFTQTAIYMVGDLIEDGELIGTYDAGTVANFYIPTKGGYLSAEWKRTKWYKMKSVELTDELLDELAPYEQEQAPKVWIDPSARGTSRAAAIANHCNKNGGDPYDIG